MTEHDLQVACYAAQWEGDSVTPRVAKRDHPKRFFWTDARLATAFQLKARRVSNKKIAHQLGTTMHVVQHKLRDFNPKLIITRITLSVITGSTAPFGGPPGATRPRSEQHIEWDEQATSELLRLSALGVRQKDIAVVLGTTVMAVKTKLFTVRNASPEKREIKKWLPCLGCRTSMWTTIKTRQCDACKKTDVYRSGL